MLANEQASDISAVFFFLFFGLSHGQTKSKAIAEFYKSHGTDCAIFPDTYSDFPFLKNKFTPTHQQVDNAELILKKQLRTVNIDSGYQNQNQGPVIHKKLNNYKRQYFGYIDKAGHRILLINFFWSDHVFGKDWLFGYVMVDDGGSSFWNIKIDLDAQKLFDLVINGGG